MKGYMRFELLSFSAYSLPRFICSSSFFPGLGYTGIGTGTGSIKAGARLGVRGMPRKGSYSLHHFSFPFFFARVKTRIHLVLVPIVSDIFPCSEIPQTFFSFFLM